MGAVGKASRKVLKAIGYVKSVNTSEEDAALLETIRKHVQLDAEATAVQRQLETEDLRFCDPATQWDDDDRRSREGAGRPCLTEDRLGPFLMQVTNEQRKNMPAVQVNPVDSGSDQDTAEILQGLIRHIEYSSNADTAYDTAFWWAAAVGRGFYRLCTDYVDSEGFDQHILIKRVPNPHMVFVDPSCQESDYSDMKWGGFKAWVSKEDFKEMYPNSNLRSASTSAWLSIGDDAPDWMSEDASACLVVEYFYKEFEKVKIKEGKREREAIKTTVKWVKCTAVEILERGELPGEYIPIVAVLGKEIIQDGQRTYAGVIRAGKDPQKRLNYLLTAQVERIAFMPLATWVGPKGFMGKNQKIWQNAHKNQMAALEYEIIGDEGQGINKPQLITEEAPIVAVTNAYQGAVEGMKGTIGMFDPSLGNREGSQSGIAITRLQAQGETGNYHLQDNLSRAMRYEGRIILSWVPTVYDTDRVIRIIGEDETQGQVRINGEIQAPEEAPKNDKAKIGKIFDLTTGKYDVTISAGPSYQSKRQEDRAMLLGMLQGPMGQIIAQRAGDLVAKTLDSPIARDLAERLTPPDIAAKEQQGGDIPPQIQQQMQQAQQMVQALTQKVHELTDQLETKQLENEAKLTAAQIASQTDIEVAKIRAEAQIIQAKLQAKAPTDDANNDANAILAQLTEHVQDLQDLVAYHHDMISQPPSAPPMAPEPAAPSQPAPGPMAGAQPLANAGMEQQNA